MKISLTRLLVVAALAVGLTIGSPRAVSWAAVCQEEGTATTADTADAEETTTAANEDARQKAQPKSAGYEFEKPFRIEADGEPIAVESPGYACPTFADVDGDGVPDLVVGQFRGGNMMFYKNLASLGETPKFAAGEWLKTEEARAMVPGVW